MSSMMTHYARPEIDAVVTYASIPVRFGNQWVKRLNQWGVTGTPLFHN